jgi:transposase
VLSPQRLNYKGCAESRQLREERTLNSEETMEESHQDFDEISLCIGIDWADRAHVYKMAIPGSSKQELGSVQHSPEALTEWIMNLQKKYPAGKIAIALEQSRGALIHFLQQFAFLILYPINPKSLAKFREFLRPSCSKDDPDDAGCLLEIILFHRRKLRPLSVQDKQTRKLGLLCELRRQAVDQRTTAINRITSWLKFYFPQALDWAGDLSSAMGCDFLMKWPTLQTLKKARPATIRTFYTSHHSRNSKLIDQRIDQISSSMPLTSDEAIIDPYSMAVVNSVRQVIAINKAIEEFDEQIQSLFAQHTDHALFEALPGAGPVMAPRLLASLGTDRNRYQSAVELQQFSGIAPITKQSGNSKSVSRRYARPVFVCQTWIEFALHSRLVSVWANAYYLSQRKLKKKHYAALRALAYKWQRIIFRCWKLNVPYNEQKYIEALTRRNSPLIQMLKIA